MEIRIPNLSEGVESGTVVAILVAVGDAIEKDQTILELETDKAVAPIPASVAGKVSKVLIKEGDQVQVGQAVFEVEASDSDATSATQNTPQAAAPTTQAPVQAQAAPVANFQAPTGTPPAASPTVRKMARELGIDLTRVRGTENGGRISTPDLRDYIQQIQQLAFAAPAQTAPAAQAAAPSKPKVSIDFSQWGTVRKEALTSLRKTIGDHLVDSWTSIPHVTQFDEADVTDLLALRKSIQKDKGLKATVTAFIIKAVVKALKEVPIFNASLDEVTREVVYKEYCHIGIAVDTDAGLIVPVLRDVDQKSLSVVSDELGALAQKTRDRKVAVEDLKGGSFTISNLGGIGGTHFTPIINKPELAILALGKAVEKPVARNGKVVIRTMLPVGVSYDHRIIDGADGARFIRAIVDSIEGLKAKDLGL